MGELTPISLSNLLTRMLVERERGEEIFNLPRRSFFTGAPEGRDYSILFHEERAATPFGPAAGPHSQLAQNIVLAYLAGARVVELKTVQILDELKIPRPCIDAATIGYNVEWSQELRVHQSRDEYVKAWILIHILRALGEPARDTDLLFDLSVGYNLDGIKGPKVTGFIQDMKDARHLILTQLDTLGGTLRRWRDLGIPPNLIDCCTLSTFHGCPGTEIESIVAYLMEELGLNVVIKLNPTLIGKEQLHDVVRGQLGYDELVTPDSAFAHDLAWDQALAMIHCLHERGKKRGVQLGVKLTNTLIVENRREFFPRTEKEMYASGEPLHVVAMQLLAKLRPHLPAGMPISFSAGIDKDNAADAVALGLTPVTCCTDMLRPGGYGRLNKYFPALDKRMTEVGAKNINEWVLNAFGNEEKALADARKIDPHADAGGRLHVEMAARLNTPIVAEAALKNPRYAAEKNRKPPRKVGSHLSFFDCLSCDKCIPVCPNAANFPFETEVRELEAPVFHVEDGKLVKVRDQQLKVGKDHQLANFADLCNECGNCDVFCPEDGGPYVVKPRFFGNVDNWRDGGQRDGFFVHRSNGTWRIDGRIDGVSCALEEHDGERTYEESGARILFVGGQPGPLSGASTNATIHWANARVLSLLLDAVRRPEHISWVNAQFLQATV